MIRDHRSSKKMKNSCFAIFAAATLAGTLAAAPPALACSPGDGNCENAPGHNKDKGFKALLDLSLAQGFPF
jgi:hypothetical protein